MGTWKTVSTKIVYKNPRFSIREDKVIRPNGDEGIFHIMDRPSVVIIVPVTKDKEIYLIRINRYTTKKTHWELPAGSSDNQDELLAAKRELKEETGLISEKWTKLGAFEVAPGMTGQLAYVFLAEEVAFTKENQQKEENIDKIRKFSTGELFKMIREQKIVNGPTITSILKAELKLKDTVKAS